MTYNKKILTVLVVLSLLFLSLGVYLTYFQVFRSKDVVASTYNRRLWEKEDSVLRGSILDRNGTVLAKSTKEGDADQVRQYPYGRLYSHVIGYNSRTYGKSRLELQYNDYLLGASKFSEVLNLKETLSGGAKKGADLRLTIDHEMQEIASDAMGDRNGAAIAINPKTGEVLALVSKPDFNPSASSLEENWSDLSDDEDSPFLTRATMGLYCPGSTFKTVIATAAIENGMEGEEFEDEGSVTIGGKTFTNSGEKAYGTVDMSRALAVSSNVVFTQIAVSLGDHAIKDVVGRYQIGKSIPFDISTQTSRFPYSGMSKTDLASVGIGQGKLQITPLNMALVAAAIANDGTMMSPYLVDSATSSGGLRLMQKNPSTLSNVCSASVANKITDMMVECVESGTGTAAQISGIEVAGKTGTAENERDKEHTWFIGFAPAQNPEIAVAVMLEYDGTSGGGSCAPIARKMMKHWLNQ